MVLISKNFREKFRSICCPPMGGRYQAMFYFIVLLTGKFSKNPCGFTFIKISSASLSLIERIVVDSD